MMQHVHIGLDDIDSPYGGCSTHFASLILTELIEKFRVKLIDYPNIVRLNPSVPWKTRGNGSVVLRFKASEDVANDVYEHVINRLHDYLEEYSKGWREHSQPVVSMVIGEPSSLLAWFSKKAIQDLVPLDLALRIIERDRGVRFKLVAGKSRGLIGSLAGIGYRMLNSDYTYELIVYRDPSFIGSVRRVDACSVKKMDQAYGYNTFLNYDYEVNKPLIIPKGPDPILLGIRGEEPDSLYEAFKTLVIDEPTPLTVLFRTNQHTDAHLRKISSISCIRPFMCVIVRGCVSSKPRRIAGGHTVFSLRDETGEVDVAAFEPTGGFRDIIEKLEPGDSVEVMGVARLHRSFNSFRLTINLEKIRIIEIKRKIIYANPFCPKCRARMKSAGRNKGFKCFKCGYVDKSLSKIIIETPRAITPGFYEPPPRVFKHLMKPLKRIGMEKSFFPLEHEPANCVWIEDKVFK